MDTILNIAGEGIQALFHAPAWLLLLIVLNLCGVYMQWVKWFPNWLIPLVLVAAGVAFLAWLGDVAMIPSTQRHPRVVLGFMGFIIGAFAYGLHGALVVAWRKWISSKLPVQPENQTPNQP